MMPIRGLTRLLAPVSGEAFGSYIDRLAACHKVTRSVMYRWLGLREDGKYHRLYGFGIVLDKVSLERFSIASQLPCPVIAKMLLSAYHDISMDLSASGIDDPESVKIWAHSEWAYFSGSHACPHCLREDHGAWKLAWKLPWTFACVKHQCYLVAQCPACRTRLSQGTPGSISPRWATHVPKPGYCINQRRENIGRSQIIPCDYDLARIPTIAASIETVRFQRTLNDYLDGASTAILGNVVSSLDYFRDLRAMCALILRCTEPGDFDHLPAGEAVALKVFCDERNRINASRSEPMTQCHNKHIKPFSKTPIIPEQMAAVVRIAIPILAADAPLMAMLLQPITKRCQKINPSNRWNYITLGFSDPIATVLVKNMEVNSSFDRAFGGKSVAARAAQFSLQPQNVPTLLWLDEFRRSFSIFFSSRVENTARCYCSMALVKLCENCTWEQAAGQLGLTAREGMTVAGIGRVHLKESNARNAFGEALQKLAKRLTDAPIGIDYAARRKTLSKFKLIPIERWSEICHVAGVPLRNCENRSIHAAVWLWAELTGSDWRRAPGIARTEDNRRVRAVYRKQCDLIIPRVEDGLRAYGSQLLQMENV
jgi:hypothetical protein